MSDQEETKNLLWMFRNQAPEPLRAEVDFDPVDAIYQLQRNTQNPYLKRTIAPTPKKLGRSPKDLSKLVAALSTGGAYDIPPANRSTPFAKRELHHPPPPPSASPFYTGVEKLPGDGQKLPWLINEFFSSILSRLQENPRAFDSVVGDLLALFRDKKVQIKLYDAYSAFEDWNDLMKTLEEISQYPSPDTFDLFCSALFTYYDLVYPPEG